jgi:hypothetical protein
MTANGESPLCLTTLRSALKARAVDVATDLLGKPNLKISRKSELRYGRKGSLVIQIVGSKIGTWFDHENGVGGDLLSLISRYRGGNFQETINYANRFVTYIPMMEESTSSRGSSGNDAVRNTQRAMTLWQEARSIAETIVPRYFAKRGIASLADDIDVAVLRYHPNCPFGGDKQPCLLALMRDVRTNEPRAIQRTAINESGDKIGRMMLGPKTGTAIKLTADEDIAMGLAIGEGLETVLSAMQMGFRPAWALGDANNLSAFPVLSGIECLTILIDNDKTGTGQRCALECSDRWTAAGHEVLHALPNHIGDDFNDVLRWSLST